MANLPRYKCHKEVCAVKIASIDVRRSVDGHPRPTSDKAGYLILSEGDAHMIEVGSVYMAKHEPEVGGYWVRYEDGYESYSPAAQFEEGYALIEEPNLWEDYWEKHRTRDGRIRWHVFSDPMTDKCSVGLPVIASGKPNGDDLIFVVYRDDVDIADSIPAAAKYGHAKYGSNF